MQYADTEKLVAAWRKKYPCTCNPGQPLCKSCVDMNAVGGWTDLADKFAGEKLVPEPEYTKEP
jgi:hypothetical protein